MLGRPPEQKVLSLLCNCFQGQEEESCQKEEMIIIMELCYKEPKSPLPTGFTNVSTQHSHHLRNKIGRQSHALCMCSVLLVAALYDIQVR